MAADDWPSVGSGTTAIAACAASNACASGEAYHFENLAPAVDVVALLEDVGLAGFFRGGQALAVDVGAIEAAEVTYTPGFGAGVESKAGVGARHVLIVRVFELDGVLQLGRLGDLADEESGGAHNLNGRETEDDAKSRVEEQGW